MARVSRLCPVCEHPEAEAFYENSMAPVDDFDMSYTVGRCQKCGFFFAHSLANDQTFQNYYQSVSKYDFARVVSNLDRLRIDATVKICQGQVPSDAMIVDLGCGYGALLSGFKKAGWPNLYGVDPAPKSAERARNLFGLERIYQGTMDNAHHLLPLAEADLVCVMAVLEHLPHLREDLADLLKKLRPGCQILVEVPARERFFGLAGEPFGEFSLEHIQFFSATSLENLFGSFGAKPLALHLVDLPVGNCDSLFGLFELTGTSLTSFEPLPENGEVMARYISDSKRRMDEAMVRIPVAPLVVYGAGSHTARLLPFLETMSGGGIIAVVDNNPNLLNKTIGKWVIQSPSIIKTLPHVHILVSSFRYQNEIAASLRDQYLNQLVLLYE